MDIKAPTFPESIADGSVAEWHYQVGDFVAKDDLLVDIETDKVVIEVYAPADGTLSSIFKGEGETVLSEEVIAQFSEGAAVATQESGSPAEAAVGDSQDADRFASPAAKKLAAENNLDWAAIAGTGKNGRITKEDVTAALSQPAADAEPIAAEVAAKTAIEPGAVAPKANNDEGRIERRVPMTRLRASVA
ncbi:MAG: E3 binding domain-containing protein, partial [Pseudomonadota bacterium]|nr:E3 binding domain-containing protein [Pseudomonadota bacterium]